MRFSALAALYLRHKSAYNKPKSQACSRQSLARLSETFGQVRATELSSDLLAKHIKRRLAAGLKPVTVNADLRTLRAVLNWAAAEGLIERVPIRVQLLRAPKRRETKVLSADDITHLLSFAEGRAYGILLLAASTGARTDELLHLTWGDVDPERSLIAIRGKGSWTPKSHQNRHVYVSAEVIAYLQERRAGSKFKADADYVFPTRQGTPLSIYQTCRMVRAVFERAGLYREGESTIHRIRHSFVTLLLERGVSIEVVRDLVGHAEITTTARYAHATEHAKRAASTMSLVSSGKFPTSTV